MSQNPSEVCLIDASITSISKLNLRPAVVSLNLHCNLLKEIDGLNNLRNLKHLDLSSNAIEAISGLSGLMVLKYLNLSCNRITVVEGLESLRFVLSWWQSCRLGIVYTRCIKKRRPLSPVTTNNFSLTAVHSNKFTG